MILLPTGWMALDLSIGDQINRGIESFISTDGTLADQKIALAFIAGALVAATPLHIVLRYMATLVHELGHAFTAGLSLVTQPLL